MIIFSGLSFAQVHKG